MPAVSVTFAPVASRYSLLLSRVSALICVSRLLASHIHFLFPSFLLLFSVVLLLSNVLTCLPLLAHPRLGKEWRSSNHLSSFVSRALCLFSGVLIRLRRNWPAFPLITCLLLFKFYRFYRIFSKRFLFMHNPAHNFIYEVEPMGSCGFFSVALVQSFPLFSVVLL